MSISHEQTITNIVIDIVKIPEQFHELRNVSANFLLEKSGYFEKHDMINEADIYAVLVKHPEYVEQWLHWSEDKRTSGGWCFYQEKNMRYVVRRPLQKTSPLEFSDVKQGCAVFIKYEIEEMRHYNV